MISDAIDDLIFESLRNFDGKLDPVDHVFEGLINFSFLIDSLSIANIKIFTLKNEVMSRQHDKEFCANAAVLDCKLVLERARIKRALDRKILSMLNSVKNGDEHAGTVEEVKNYGGET